MTGKRKRVGVTVKETHIIAPTKGSAKPISAIAAARLKAAAPIPTTDGVQEVPASPLAESSASDAAESEPEDVLPIAQNFKLSTWRNQGTNVITDTPDEFCIVLEKHATVSFVGCFKVKVLKGAVNVNGANLGAAPRQEEAKSHRVFVPSTHPITKVRGLDRTNHVQFLNCKEPAPFADISPLFSGIWSGNEKGRSFSRVTESGDDPLERPLTPEHAPEDWIRTIEDIAATASVSLIIGPPTSGKSTFARRLLNRYLTGLGKTAKAVPAVCYLDLDPSKPEYTPHGQVSLTVIRELNLGPSFTHPATIAGRSDTNELVAAHVLPVQGLTNYEDHFIECVADLFTTYQNLRLAGPTPPLVINTAPTLYTTHFHLLGQTLTTTRPNHTIHLSVPTSTSIVPADTTSNFSTLQTLASKTHTRLHDLTAQTPPLPPPRTDTDLRAMQTQSYFHATSPQLWTPSPLTTHTPWQFSYAETQTHTLDLLGILPLFDDPLPPSHLLTALNGTLIHIVRTTDPALHAQAPLPCTPKAQVPYFPVSPATALVHPPSPRASTLICTALLRGIDTTNRMLDILVPRTHEALLETLDGGTTVFVAGCCDTPEWAYTEDAYAQVARRRGDVSGRRGRVGEEVLMEGVRLGPWVEDRRVVEGMGYLGVVRRVRKFLG